VLPTTRAGSIACAAAVAPCAASLLSNLETAIAPGEVYRYASLISRKAKMKHIKAVPAPSKVIATHPMATRNIPMLTISVVLSVLSALPVGLGRS
jgi:hypothetical protein